MLNIICAYWGNKYSYDYVNILESMCKNNIHIPFKFHVIDTFAENGLWRKLELFNRFTSGTNIFFDLDIILLKTPYRLLSTQTRVPTVLYSAWKEGYQKTATMYNSSIMKWSSNQGSIIYDYYNRKRDQMLFKYDALDRFLYHEPVDVDTFQTGIAYSYHMGSRFLKDMSSQKYRDDYEVCIFNEGAKPHELNGWIHEYWK